MSTLTNSAPSDVLAQLSLEALHSAAGLGSRNVGELAHHLYSYNSLPETRSWATRFPDTGSILRHLGLSVDSHRARRLESDWLRTPASATPGWLYWSRRHGRFRTRTSSSNFKLYLSPANEYLEAGVTALIEVLPLSGAAAFKVASTADGLLRPDKIVAYFSRLDDVASAAHELAPRLAGIDIQGVPFTAELTVDGLMSWSVDPPASRTPPGAPAPSWREWICHTLAVAIAADHSATLDEPPWQAALKQLRQEHVDVGRWAPSPGFWAAR